MPLMAPERIVALTVLAERQAKPRSHQTKQHRLSAKTLSLRTRRRGTSRSWSPWRLNCMEHLTVLAERLARLHGHHTGHHQIRLSAEGPWPACTQDRNKPVLFSMARLDRVKNLTGLAELYAKNDRLRAACNLVIVGGIVDPSQVRAACTACTAWTLKPAVWGTCTLVTVEGIVDPSQMRLPVRRPSKRFALAFGVTAFPQQVHLLLYLTQQVQ